MPVTYQMTCFGNIQLITGANSSGKTTYLKTLGILSILACIGCLIPAKQAELPRFDQVFSVLGDIESLEHNNSSFLSSMQQISYVLENATENSLVLIDEIARGTSHEDGVALAWSITEHLVDTGSFCYITTHFSQLVELERLYTSVRNSHMDSFTNRDGANLDEKGYGIRTAAESGLTAEIITAAQRLSASI